MKKRIANIVIGLLFILGAAIFIASRIFDFSSLSGYLGGWWTIFIVVPAITGLFRREGRIFWLSTLLLGLTLYAKFQTFLPAVSQALESIHVWHMIVAALLVCIGLGVIFSGSGKADAHVHVVGACEDGENSASNIFGARRVSFEGHEFTGYTVNSVFGEFVLDLRGAIVNNDCTVCATSVFGSVKIISGDCNVVAVGNNTVFGTVENNASPADPSLPVITVQADAVFGEVEIQ